ncbi:MAG: tRNA (adenosine(37)-N6)-threonylcarbamoyltransferase complex ATPase subunit type 1 TsaE [Patescibacteria group bacterium]
MKFVSKGSEDTQKIAQNLLNSLKPGGLASVVALQGDLGSGKTNFTQVVGSLLGITENMQSPTFVIEKIYEINWKGFKNLIHVDAYRLEKDKELLHLGWEEILKEPENLIFIEWPENVKNIIPEYAKRVYLKFIDENTREISFES